MTIEEVINCLNAYEERVRESSEVDEKKLLLTHREWVEKPKKKGDNSKNSNKSYKSYRGNKSRGRGRGWGRGENTCDRRVCIKVINATFLSINIITSQCIHLLLFSF